jgi:hypothetical protein
MAEVGWLESSESFATLAIWGFPTHGHRVVHQQMGCCRNDIWRNCLSGTICRIWAENSHCPRRPRYLEIHCFIRYPRYPRISILGYLGAHEIPLLPRVFRVHVWGIHGIHPYTPHTSPYLPSSSPVTTVLLSWWEHRSQIVCNACASLNRNRWTWDCPN